MSCVTNNDLNTNESREKWTKGATERINLLKDQYWKNKPEIDTERARIYTRVYKETEGEEQKHFMPMFQKNQ